MGLKNTYQAKKRFVKVPVDKTGMWYQNDPVVIPSNKITMKGPNGESDYFDSPIMGIGMQSGQKQIMQPGREYSFPNDNSVYERKMQNGAEVALDVTSMIPGPVGMTASGLGLAYDLYQGDWLGAGLNTANILTGGAAKGFMAAARVANNAGTRNLARGLASSSHNLNRASKIGNSFTQPVDRARTILNSNPYQQTQFGGYQDNTRVAPMVKPRMQSGGWLKSYQDAGEVSTEQNPETIGQVHVRAKDPDVNFINKYAKKAWNLYKPIFDFATWPHRLAAKAIGEVIPKEYAFKKVRPVEYPESNPLFFPIDMAFKLFSEPAEPLKDAKGNLAPSEEIWKKSLGFKDSFNYVKPSPYKPSKIKEGDKSEYVRFENMYNPQKIINAYVKAQKTLPEGKTSVVIPSLDPYISNRKNLEGSGLAFSQQDPLQNFTLDKGEDERGKYISLYDIYDFEGPANNLVYGFGKPIEVYDRFYYEKNKQGVPVYKKKKNGGLQRSYLKTKKFK